jgi:hypothetical protein
MLARSSSAVAVALVVAAVAAVAAVAGCQGRRQDTGGAGEPGVGSAAPLGSGGSFGSGGGFGSGMQPAPADAGAELPGDARKATVDEPEAPPDPNKLIAELGAIPAWQAVVDRAQLLARRGQKGVVYGRIGPAVLVPPPPPPPGPPSPPAPAGSAAGSAGSAPIDAGLVSSPYIWLVDDSEGNGSLGIRIALGKRTVKEGDRIAASGAWELDGERRWYWKVDAIQPLSPRTASEPKDPPAAVPSHIPAAGGFPPNVRPIKQAKDNDAVYFLLVGPPPARDGDGWLVAEQLGDLPVALLILPGERPSYGGQDLRSPDERWQLKLRTTYWVRIGKIRPQGAGKPAVVRAVTGPIRVM